MRSLFKISILFFLIPLSGSGQTDYRISYHPFINEAELAIVDNNYRLALEYYKRAFKLMGYGFGKDYNNAALCAIELDEYDTAIKLLNALTTKGVTRDYYEDHLHLYVKLIDHGLEEFLANIDQQRKNTFEKTENEYLLNVLLELNIKDQEFRHDTATYQDTIQKIDAKNLTQFLELVEEYGFPTEEMLGLDSPYANKFIYHPIILHHLENWKKDKSLFDLRPIIKGAVKNGYLFPEQSGEYHNIVAAKVGAIGNYGNIDVLKFDNEAKLYIVESKHPGLIDHIRKKLGLYSLDDFEKKARFHFITENQQSKFKVLQLGNIAHHAKDVKTELDVKELK